MGLNPTESGNPDDWRDETTIGLEGATVINTQTHREGDNISHEIYVRPDTMDTDVVADVGINQTGDVQIPQEGSRVIIGYRANERPIVVGQRYSANETIPEFEPGERVIGHPLSDSNIRLATNGSVTVTDDDGTTITLDGAGEITLSTSDGTTVSIANGDVVINGGTTQAVTDVTPGETNDNGGITSLSVSRSPSVYVPE